MKIVFVNSHGPMGSSCVAAIIEHLGFNNIPLRKLGLLEYLTYKLPNDYDMMIKKFQNTIDKHTEFRTQGGVNVIDRNSAKPIKFLDKKTIKKNLKKIINQNINNPILLYEQLRLIYSKSVLYKEMNYDYLGNIELTTRIHDHNPKELYNVIKKNFDEFYIINIKRDFTSWVNSLVSQWYLNNDKKFKFKLLNIRGLYLDYRKYNNFVDNFPGMKINFEDIFLPNTNKIIKEIKFYLSSEHNINWKIKSYDLYGKIVNYDKAFTKRDDNIEYLTETTKKLIKLGEKNNYKNLVNLFLINFFYFVSIFTMKFRLNKKSI